ncbi:MAG: MFS transporter [Chitinophagaceae bacterium]|nr:MAG: MFS transporter [Chitinophagaceae bacterium]
MSTNLATNRPVLSISQIINMSVGFFGIQFGWDLQRANMGRIYENLGANADEIPYLFLAAPLTGLIVQPIIGYMSDRTWHPVYGRRRPYFLIGAILASAALLFMPFSSEIWMAAGLLWILSTSGNIAMEPFRAFVTDKLPDSQVNRGFIMQSLMIGLGGTIASSLPWLMQNVFNVANTSVDGRIPANVQYSFFIGAFFFLTAVLYTVFTSKEYPPEQLPADKQEEAKRSFSSGVSEIFEAVRNMPSQMKRVALVQFFTWPGLFLMWFYYTTAVAVNVFHGVNDQDPVYSKGADFAGLTLAFYNVVTFIFAFILPSIADRLGRRVTHALCLACGAIGLVSVGFVSHEYMLYACMTGIGIAMASILSMPYAMLSGSLPRNKIGVYMGIFNFFIVLPEIIASLGFKHVMKNILHNDRMLAIQLGGGFLALAAVICYFVVKDKTENELETVKLEIEEARSI